MCAEWCSQKKNIGVPFYWRIHGEKREVLKEFLGAQSGGAHEAAGRGLELGNWLLAYSAASVASLGGSS